MRRRRFVASLMIGPSAAAPVIAQAPGPVRRIGLLFPTPEALPLDRARLALLRAELRERGWIEGRNLVIESRHAGLDPQRQRAHAAELKALPVALIVASGTITIRAARDGAPGLPIVMINAGDPVGAGFVASLARPGGDLTGTSAAGEEIIAKQMELLTTAAPQRKRVGVLMNHANPLNGFLFDALSARAHPLGLQIDRIEVGSAGELDAAVARSRGGSLVVLGDPMFSRHRERIVELALRHQVPAISGGRPFVAAGGLMSYLSADAWHWRSAAGFVDRLLRGAQAAELPVEQPTQFELVINLKTARTLGLVIPQQLLLRADEVIE